LTITDGELIRPVEEPTEADIIFDWYSVQQDALKLRSELRRQQMLVRKREMELLAARNFLNPRLDAVARYRFRGFGDDLINTEGANNNNAPASALGHLANGDFQEWLLGFEYEVPLGYRRGHLAVQNAELQLSRERIIHREQQREIVHNLSNAITDAARAYEACQNSLNRFHAARELLDAYDAQGESGRDVDVDHLLDAQRRVVEAELRYYRSRTEYAVALKNVHLEKGSLLSYHNLHIFEHQPHTAVSTTETPAATEKTAPADDEDENQADDEDENQADDEEAPQANEAEAA
ncbi:MAG: TolC family protein, partial [Fuerstiella sp.]|nr:TolC family protein [Fuerstiella sp.]